MPLTLTTITPDHPEIFAALRGEGPSAGKSCAFIRLSRCNLACVWCDTAYSWRFTGNDSFDRKANQITLTPAEAAARIIALKQNRMVITGGEPLLQGAALAEMIAHLPPMAIEVETNGTVAPQPALDRFITQYTVSPKLTHSGNAAKLALPPERLTAWAKEPRAVFKFVIAAPEDVEEVLAIQQIYAIPKNRIWLMPEGRDSATLKQRLIWLGDMCSKQQFNLSDRLHIHTHGDTRGT